MLSCEVTGLLINGTVEATTGNLNKGLPIESPRVVYDEFVEGLCEKIGELEHGEVRNFLQEDLHNLRENAKDAIRLIGRCISEATERWIRMDKEANLIAQRLLRKVTRSLKTPD